MPIVTPGTYSPAALISEINGDPIGVGYAAAAGNPSDVAGLLNQTPEPTGVTGGQESIFKKHELVENLIPAIVAAEYEALSQAKRDELALVFSTQYVKTGDAALRTLIAAIFPAGATRTALIAAASRLCSRAEALWGDGFRVTDQQVAAALGQT
jgi:hypothetical protein